MRGLAGARVCWRGGVRLFPCLEQQKNSPSSPMGQELHSCDTTQIDVLETSARFTRHHACPMDNGWVPVGIYLVSRSSRPRKSIRPAAPRPDPTTQGSLKVCRTSYFSFSQVSLLFDCYGYYSGSAHLCQPPIFRLGKALYWGIEPGRPPCGRRPTGC